MMYSSTYAVAFTIGSLTVHWYGVIMSLSMLLAVVLSYCEAKRQRLDADEVTNFALLILPSAIIGARLWYVLFHWEYYGANPGEIIAIWKGGSAIHGGIILCVIVLLIYCKKRKLDFLRWVDLIVPNLALAQCVGRWGNFFNQELYGLVIEPGSRWAWIPLQVYADGAYHHPTFLYESVWNLLVFIVLTILLRRKHRIGSIFAYYLIFYSMGRAMIEFLRLDSLMLGPIRVSVLVSLLAIVIGLVLLHKIAHKPLVDVSKPLPPDKRAKQKKKKKK